MFNSLKELLGLSLTYGLFLFEFLEFLWTLKARGFFFFFCIISFGKIRQIMESDSILFRGRFTISVTRDGNQNQKGDE